MTTNTEVLGLTSTLLVMSFVATLQASERRSLKHKMEETRQELRLANKALTEVSRLVQLSSLVHSLHQNL